MNFRTGKMALSHVSRTTKINESR